MVRILALVTLVAPVIAQMMGNMPIPMQAPNGNAANAGKAPMMAGNSTQPTGAPKAAASSTGAAAISAKLTAAGVMSTGAAKMTPTKTVNSTVATGNATPTGKAMTAGAGSVDLAPGSLAALLALGAAVLY